VAAETGIDAESTRVIIVIEVSNGVHINVFKMVFILAVSDFSLIVWVACAQKLVRRWVRKRF
jgi:hypothetical protein